ncbi:MAG: MFS transporter, partial [Actinomycetota bacterium]|nr:MFS transporter [Actinomycetota bacterium]
LVTMGRLADRYGRRRLFTIGLVVFSAASLLVGLAPDVAPHVGARALQGVGGALLLPASLGLLLAVTPTDRRSTMVAAWGALSSLGIATGPSVGAVIVEFAGWRWAFLILPPVALVSWLFGRGHLVDPPTDPTAPVPDIAGSALLMGAVASFVFAISQSRPWGWSDPGVRAAFALAAAFAVVFALRSRRHPAPVLPLDLFRSRAFSASNTSALVLSIALGGILLVNILFLTGVWGYSILGAGLASTPAPLVVTVVSPLAGRLADRIGERPLAAPGALVFASGVVWYLWRVGESAAYWTEWLPGNIAVGVGIGMTLPMLSSSAVRDVAADRYAVAGGVLQTARQIGSALGVALVVAIIGDPGPDEALAAFDRAWVVIAVLGASSAITSWSIGPRPPVTA